MTIPHMWLFWGCLESSGGHHLFGRVELCRSVFCPRLGNTFRPFANVLATYNVLLIKQYRFPKQIAGPLPPALIRGSLSLAVDHYGNWVL